MKKRILAMLAVCVLLLFQAFAIVHAAVSYGGTAAWDGEPARVEQLGVGNQNSYSSGGSSSGGSSSSGGGYSGGYGGYSSGGVFVGGFGGGSLGLIIAAIVIIVVINGMRQNKNRPVTQNVQPGAQFIRPAVSPAATIQKTDPNFSETAFLSWANEVFITLNAAWTKQDWSMIRPFESEELFREHSQQLDEYKRNGTVNYLERVAVKDSFLDRYYTESGYEYLVVKMRTNMIDYVKETETGKIVAGDATTLWQMVHTLTFMRTAGTQTKENPGELHVTNCPNCGAPSEITSAGQCPYCQSVITTGEFNWVLCKFTGENL